MQWGPAGPAACGTNPRVLSKPPNPAACKNPCCAQHPEGQDSGGAGRGVERRPHLLAPAAAAGPSRLGSGGVGGGAGRGGAWRGVAGRGGAGRGGAGWRGAGRGVSCATLLVVPSCRGPACSACPSAAVPALCRPHAERSPHVRTVCPRPRACSLPASCRCGGTRRDWFETRQWACCACRCGVWSKSTRRWPVGSTSR